MKKFFFISFLVLTPVNFFSVGEQEKVYGLVCYVEDMRQGLTLNQQVCFDAFCKQMEKVKKDRQRDYLLVCAQRALNALMYDHYNANDTLIVLGKLLKRVPPGDVKFIF